MKFSHFAVVVLALVVSRWPADGLVVPRIPMAAAVNKRSSLQAAVLEAPTGTAASTHRASVQGGIPDDNFIRTVYDRWRSHHGKGPSFDGERFENFRRNYISLIKAKGLKHDRGTKHHTMLNQHADCSVEEYERIMRKRNQFQPMQNHPQPQQSRNPMNQEGAYGAGQINNQYGNQQPPSQPTTGQLNGNGFPNGIPVNQEVAYGAGQISNQYGNQQPPPQRTTGQLSGNGFPNGIPRNSSARRTPPQRRSPYHSNKSDQRIWPAYVEWCRLYSKQQSPERFQAFKQSFLEAEHLQSSGSGMSLSLNSSADRLPWEKAAAADGTKGHWNPAGGGGMHNSVVDRSIHDGMVEDGIITNGYRMQVGTGPIVQPPPTQNQVNISPQYQSQQVSRDNTNQFGQPGVQRPPNGARIESRNTETLAGAFRSPGSDSAPSAPDQNPLQTPYPFSRADMARNTRKFKQVNNEAQRANEVKSRVPIQQNQYYVQPSPSRWDSGIGNQNSGPTSMNPSMYNMPLSDAYPPMLYDDDFMGQPLHAFAPNGMMPGPTREFGQGSFSGDQGSWSIDPDQQGNNPERLGSYVYQSNSLADRHENVGRTFGDNYYRSTRPPPFGQQAWQGPPRTGMQFNGQPQQYHERLVPLPPNSMYHHNPHNGSQSFAGSMTKEDEIWAAYLGWCQHYGKETDMSRFAYFKENYRAIERSLGQQNAGVKLNEFADMSLAEYEWATSRNNYPQPSGGHGNRGS